jgi:voltage-gated potassium channel
VRDQTRASPKDPIAPGAPIRASRQLQRRVWDALDGDPETAPEARWIELALQALIITNVVAVVVETMPGVRTSAGAWLDGFEIFSIAVFTLEYLARLWSAPAAGKYGITPTRARFRYARTPLALVDLAVILPAFIAGVGLDLRVLRVLRLIRLLRVAKLMRYVRAVRVIGRVLRAKRDQLTIVAVALGLLLVISASLVYGVEHDAQPERFASIPDAMWWAVATLTTVGYGDVYPVTPLGKLLGAIIAVGGIAFFALPAGILGAGFLEILQESVASEPPHAYVKLAQQAEAGPPRCPHCGGDLPRDDQTPFT